MATEEHFETSHRFASSRDTSVGQWPGQHSLKDVLEGIERDLILAALQASHGNKSKAARALSITERFIGLRVKRLGIDWRGFRPRRKRAA